ncbi:hypothetical protein SAMN04487897_10336 [Paenibacillus sp. yr247]|nr:hypothetical protein SAMN04487897_10336 [Paenibacillus sp. yr247]
MEAAAEEKGKKRLARASSPPLEVVPGRVLQSLTELNAGKEGLRPDEAVLIKDQMVGRIDMEMKKTDYILNSKGYSRQTGLLEAIVHTERGDMYWLPIF